MYWKLIVVYPFIAIAAFKENQDIDGSDTWRPNCNLNEYFLMIFPKEATGQLK